MASSSSLPSNPLVAVSVTEKLSKPNHALWKAQVRSAIRGTRLEGHLTGVTKAPPMEIKDKDGKAAINPEFQEWETRDQQILNFLFSSLAKDVMSHVASTTTAAAAWRSIEAMFASQTRARVINLRLALSTTKKGALSVAEYYTKMKSYGDDVAAAGRPLDDGELVEYIITGLDDEFESHVSALIARVEPVGLDELYSQMLSFETRREIKTGGGEHGTANWAGRGGRGGSSHPGAPVVAAVVGALSLVAGVVSTAPTPSTTHAKEAPPTPADPTTTTRSKSVKSASREATPLLSAGTTSRRTMFQKRSTWPLLPHTPMGLTPTGTLIPVQPTILQEN